jgi:broad specificity phosphatase PhoE
MGERNVMTEQVTRIVLVRHGQTAWNKEVRFRGRADVPLDAFGLKQAAATGRYLAARWPVQAVYASPMQRAMQTAEAIAQAHGLDAQAFEGLLDIDYGQWQGRAPEDVGADDPDLLQAWWEAPHTVEMPGGESLDDVRTRVVVGLEEIVDRHPGQAVAMVGHTVVNRVLLCAILGLSNEHFWRLRQATCAVNVFDVESDGDIVLDLFNDTCHLRDLVA